MLLAGDIGGTKTDLGIFSPEKGPRAPLVQAGYPSQDYPSLEAIVHEFLVGVDMPIEAACFDVAGPVEEGRAKITNLPWVVDARNLEKELSCRSVVLINDLESIARAIPVLEPEDLHTLNAGEPNRGGAIAVVAPGTGLGEAYLTWDGSRYLAHPSEGGHADFAPSTPIEIGLLDHLMERYHHVSVERVCSGLGIPNIYKYLRDSRDTPENEELAERMAAAEDLTPLIVEAALDPLQPSPLCTATLETFVSILGAEAGNLAIKLLSTGGVYLAGGIPPRIIPALEEGRFMQAFVRKGRMNDVLAPMPVHVVMQRKAALFGAAQYGLELLNDLDESR